MIRCPTCNDRLSHFAIKKRFRCKSCGQELKSNITFALLVSFVVWGIFAPAAGAALCRGKDLCAYLVDVVVGLVIFLLIYPVLLHVEKVDESEISTKQKSEQS